MRFSILALLILFSSAVYSQGLGKSNREWYDYPFENSYKPLEVNSNIILLYRNDGTGNFNMNDSEQRALLNEYLEEVNKIYSSFKKPKDQTGCYNGNDFFPDMKIRMKYNIYQVRNEYAWNYLNSGARPEEKKYTGLTPYKGWYAQALDDSISAAPNIPKGINVYLTSNAEKFDEIERARGKGFDLTSIAAAELPSDKDLTRSSQVNLTNRYLKYLYHRFAVTAERNKSWSEIKGWHLDDGKTLAHEFGHNFGLHHFNEHHMGNKCTYSIMHQKHNTERNWLPPTEIKLVHWNLTRTNLMQFVTPESEYGATWYLKKDTTWDTPRRFYHNFDLEKGMTLTISEKIILPPKSFVNLGKDAKIVLTGNGKIVDAYGKEYTNFRMGRNAQIIKE